MEEVFNKKEALKKKAEIEFKLYTTSINNTKGCNDGRSNTTI